MHKNTKIIFLKNILFKVNDGIPVKVSDFHTFLAGAVFSVHKYNNMNPITQIFQPVRMNIVVN